MHAEKNLTQTLPLPASLGQLNLQAFNLGLNWTITQALPLQTT